MSEIPESLREVLIVMLKAAADRFHEHSCNDMDLPNTAGVREWVIRLEQMLGRGDDDGPDEGRIQQIVADTRSASVCVHDGFMMDCIVEFLEASATH